MAEQVVPEAFIGNIGEGGRVGIAFRPPVALTQELVDKAIGTAPNRVTVGEQKLSVPEASVYDITVTDAEGDLGIIPHLHELGRRIGVLAFREGHALAQASIVEGYRKAPIAGLVSWEGYSSQPNLGA